MQETLPGGRHGSCLLALRPVGRIQHQWEFEPTQRHIDIRPGTATSARKTDSRRHMAVEPEAARP